MVLFHHRAYTFLPVAWPALLRLFMSTEKRGDKRRLVIITRDILPFCPKKFRGSQRCRVDSTSKKVRSLDPWLARYISLCLIVDTHSDS